MLMMPMKVSVLLSLLLFNFTIVAAPQVQINDLVEVVDHDRTTLQKQVYNLGDMTAFVRTEVREVEYDKIGQEHNRSAVDGVRENGLHISPARMIIPSGSFQVSRALYVGPRDKERYFRVRFSPTLPKDEDRFGLNKDEANDYHKKLGRSGFQLLSGYGVLYIIKPVKGVYNTIITNDGGFINILNGGNSSIRLQGFSECKKNGGDCGLSQDIFITPGITKNMPKKPGHIYSFYLVENDDSVKKTVIE